MGKQRYSCFQAKGPQLLSINQQSRPRTGETRPKRLPGTSVGLWAAWGARAHPARPRPTREPRAGEGAGPLRSPRCEFKSRRFPGTLAPHGARQALLRLPRALRSPLPRPYPAHNKGGSLMDARTQPTGVTGGDPLGEGTWRCHARPPRGGQAGGAGPGTKGPRGEPGAQGGTPGERSRPGTHLCSGPAALLVEQEGGRQQQQPDAEPGPHGGAPGAAGTGGYLRGTAAGVRGAAAGGSLAEGRGASTAHRPGRGGSRRRLERGPASSPICWRCPLPSAACGRRLKGEDPAARVRGGGSAQPGIVAAARRDARAPRSAPTGGSRATPRPRARPPGREPKTQAGTQGPARATALPVCRGRALLERRMRADSP